MGYNELQVSEEQVWKPALTTQDIHTNLEQDKDDEEVSWKLPIISGRQFLIGRDIFCVNAGRYFKS